jgi:hypothetical protein
LAAGEVVCAMIDRAEARHNTISIHTGSATLHICDVLHRTAERVGAPTVLCSARTERGAIVLTWRTVKADFLKEYADFALAEMPATRGDHAISSQV